MSVSARAYVCARMCARAFVRVHARETEGAGGGGGTHACFVYGLCLRHAGVLVIFFFVY